MDSKHLRSFLHIAELGSLSLASQRLGLSQPALSRQLKSLEAQAGTRLLERTGRGVELTEAGRILAEKSAVIIDELEQLSAELASLQGKVQGKLCIGFPPAVGSRIAGPVIEQFHRQYPDVQLRVVQVLSGALEKALLEGRIDMGILYEGALSANLHTEFLWQENMQLICPLEDEEIYTRYLQPDQSSVTLTEALSLPLILPNRPHGLRAMLEREAFRTDISLNTVIEAASMQLQTELVRRGMGFTVLPEGMQAQEGLRTMAIISPQLQRKCLLAWSKDQSLSRAGQAMQEIIQRQLISCPL